MDGISKVGTGMNIPQKVETAPVKKEEAAKIDTKDGFKGSVEDKPKEMAGWKRGIIKFTDRISGTAGVLAGGALGTAGLYVGAAGGAIALGIVGGAMAPAIAAVTGGGLLAGIGTSFATVGTMGKIGMVAGSLITGHGLFKTGRKLVGSIGTGVRKILGAPVEKPDVDESKEAPKKPGLLSTLVAAVGAGSGLVGGAVAGAGVAAAGATVAGLLATGVTLAAITGPAAIGAGIGAAVFGVGGYVGAWSGIDKVKSGVKWVGKKLFQGRKFAELQKKEELLTTKEGELKTAAEKLQGEITEAKQLHAQRSREQDQRDKFLKTEETRLDTKEANMDKIIDTKSDEMYKEKATDLFKKEGQLNVKEENLNDWQAKVDKKEKEVDQHIENGAQQLYDKRKVALETEYTDKFTRIREIKTKLDIRKKKIDEEVASKVEAKWKPLEKEWNGKLNSARDKEYEADRKLRNANRELSTAQSLRSEASRERDAARNERNRYERLNQEVQNARQQVESDKRRLQQKEQYLNRWEKELQAKANQVGK